MRGDAGNEILWTPEQHKTVLWGSKEEAAKYTKASTIAA